MRITVTGTREMSDRFRDWSRALTGSAQRPSFRIARREVPYWQERGWTRSGETYTGAYRTPYGSYRGLIEDRVASSPRFYLFDPPGALRSSSHWACFRPRGQNQYLVHMSRVPNDISSGILTIERLLTECLQPSPLWRALHDFTRNWRRQFFAVE